MKAAIEELDIKGWKLVFANYDLAWEGTEQYPRPDGGQVTKTGVHLKGNHGRRGLIDFVPDPDAASVRAALGGMLLKEKPDHKRKG